MQQPLTCVEICAGAGGQALGLAMAGFIHVALVEYEKDYCTVLKQNRPEWKKTIACRMIGNAFPPPVAMAVGEKIKECLEHGCIDSECKISVSQKVV